MEGKVLIITTETLGTGDDRLGEMLMASFLRTLGDNDAQPSQLIFVNGGVKLVCEGSKVLDHVKKLARQGADVLACTTCLEYYDLEEKIVVGEKSTMGAAIDTMMSRDVITL